MSARWTHAISFAATVACGCRAPSDSKPMAVPVRNGAGTTTLVRDTAGMKGPPTSDSLTPLLGDLVPRLASLRVSIDSFRAVLLVDSGTTRADSALLAFRRSFTTEVRAVDRAYGLNEYFQRTLYPAVMKRMGEHVDPAVAVAADSVDHLLNAYGIWTAEGEGNAQLEVNESWLFKLAEPFVTEPTRAFLRFVILEQTIPFGHDAEVTIGWDAFSDRLAMLDSLIAAFPSAVVKETLSREYAWHLHVYFSGMDNSALFDRESRVLLPEGRRTYERYLVRHGSTVTGEIIRGYLDVLRANDYQDEPAVMEYARKHVDERELRKRD